MKKVKNAPLEASNVAVLLEHIPIGQTRSIHSLQVKRVEADHYSIEGGPVVDLVDALSQVGSYSGKAHNPGVQQASMYDELWGGNMRSNPKGRPGPFDGRSGEDYDPNYVTPQKIKTLNHMLANALQAAGIPSGKYRFYATPERYLGLGDARAVKGKFWSYSHPEGPWVGIKAAETIGPADNTITRAMGYIRKWERDPPGYAATARNPAGHNYAVKNAKGVVVALTTTKAEAQSVCPKGGCILMLV